jgi:hypothetical protein
LSRLRWIGFMHGSRAGSPRSEPRAGSREYLSGLVAGLERKDRWTFRRAGIGTLRLGMTRRKRWLALLIPLISLAVVIHCAVLNR